MSAATLPNLEVLAETPPAVRTTSQKEKPPSEGMRTLVTWHDYDGVFGLVFRSPELNLEGYLNTPSHAALKRETPFEVQMDAWQLAHDAGIEPDPSTAVPHQDCLRDKGALVLVYNAAHRTYLTSVLNPIFTADGAPDQDDHSKDQLR